MLTLDDFQWMDDPKGNQIGVVEFNNAFSIKIVEVKMYNMQTFYLETFKDGQLQNKKWIEEKKLAPCDGKEGYLADSGGIITMSLDYIGYYMDEIVKL